MKCYMRSKQGENDYSMFINEYPDGGFRWEFLDYKPDDITNYKPIYVYKTDQQEEIERLKERIKDLRDDCKNCNSKGF